MLTRSRNLRVRNSLVSSNYLSCPYTGYQYAFRNATGLRCHTQSQYRGSLPTSTNDIGLEAPVLGDDTEEEEEKSEVLSQGLGLRAVSPCD